MKEKKINKIYVVVYLYISEDEHVEGIEAVFSTEKNAYLYIHGSTQWDGVTKYRVEEYAVD